MPITVSRQVPEKTYLSYEGAVRAAERFGETLKCGAEVTIELHFTGRCAPVFHLRPEDMLYAMYIANAGFKVRSR